MSYMQVNGLCRITVRLLLAGALIALAASARAEPQQPASIALQNRIDQIMFLAESQVKEPIEQLVQIRKSQNANTSLADQRLVLSALARLYSRDAKQDATRDQITALRALADRYNDDYSRALALDFESRLLIDQGKLDDAKKIDEQALALAKTVKSPQLTRQIETSLSGVTSDQGNFEAALQYQLAAMELMNPNDPHDDLDRIGGFNSIGTFYLNLKDPRLALDFFAKATTIAQSIGAQRRLTTLALNRGVAYSYLERYEEAIGEYLATQSLAQKIGDRRNETLAVNNLADSYYRLNKFDSCLRYAKQTIALADQLDNADFRANGLANLGLCHMAQGAIALGAREVNQGIEIMRKEGVKTSVEDLYGQLASAYEHAGLYREAYRALAQQMTLSTELFKSDRDRAVSELKEKYDASEREKQIEVLEQKNQVQSVELRNKGLQRVIATLATLIAISVAGTILMLYRKVRRANRSLEEANLKLAHQSTRDPLTGLYNRRAFHDAMKYRSVKIDRRAGEKLNPRPPHALVMLDIDHFKRINDTSGHAAGDAVLIELSRRLTQVMRDKDMLMRWGGEEFLIFLNHIPDARLAQVMERILITVGSRPVTIDKKTIQVTISAGFVVLPAGVESDVDPNWEKMLNLADSALYMAKTRGRNQAIGLRQANFNTEELDTLLAGELDHAILDGRVAVEQIVGPVQNETVTEY